MTNTQTMSDDEKHTPKLRWSFAIAEGEYSIVKVSDDGDATNTVLIEQDGSNIFLSYNMVNLLIEALQELGFQND